MKTLAFPFLFIVSLFSGSVYSQNGVCLNYQLISYDMPTDTLKVCSFNGNTLNRVIKPSGQASYRSLKLKDKPAENYALYPDNTYRMIPDVQIKEYEVTVMGREKVNGYNCTKISVVTFQQGQPCYLWMTDELPGSKDFTSISVIDFKLERINEALLKKNITPGVPVKIAYKVPAHMHYNLISAGNCEVNPVWFDLNQYTPKPPVDAK